MAISGCVFDKQLVLDTFRPVQNGQPVMPFGEVNHSWSSPLSHFHHTFLLDSLEISVGFSSPFLVGCQNLATSGRVVSKLFFESGYLPEQKGQLLPFTLFPKNVIHS